MEITATEITAKGVYFDNSENVKEIREDLEAVLESSAPKAQHVKRLLDSLRRAVNDLESAWSVYRPYVFQRENVDIIKREHRALCRSSRKADGEAIEWLENNSVEPPNTTPATSTISHAISLPKP